VHVQSYYRSPIWHAYCLGWPKKFGTIFSVRLNFTKYQPIFAVGRRIRDREVASSNVRFAAVPPLGATLGKLFTHMCLYSFTKQYKLVPASAGGKVHHRSGVGYTGCWQPFGGPCGWRPTGATPSSFLPVVAVVQRP